MSSQAVASGLTLEAYLQLHKALTKHGQSSTGVVQSVTTIEECFYKMGDLRQLLQLHGLAAGKFNRAELLAALKGQPLINPCSSSSSSSCLLGTDAADGQLTDDASELPFTAADVCSVLGVSGPGTRPLQFLQLGPAAPFHAALQEDTATAADAQQQAAAGAAGVTATTPAAAAAAAVETPAAAPPPPPPPAVVQAHLAAPAPHQAPAISSQQVPSQPAAATAAGGPPAPLSGNNQPDPLHQLLAALLNQHHSTTAATSSTQQQQPAAASDREQPGQNSSGISTAELLQQLLLRSTGVQQQTSSLLQANQQPAITAPTAVAAVPAAPAPAVQQAAQAATERCAEPDTAADTPQQPSHTPWLQPQLQWLAQHGMRVVPAAAAGCCGTDGELAGCRVGFVLLEEMQVAGPRNTILTLPPAFYEGMAVRYLGSSCQPEVCEADCPGQHQFYRARILPPRALPEPDDSSSSSSSGTRAELAATLTQAQAASSGRPILLILDLHSRLRSSTPQDMLRIETPEQLQDAWVLLEPEAEAEEEREEQPASSTAQVAADAGPLPPAPTAAQKRGRQPASGRGGQHKRARH